MSAGSGLPRPEIGLVEWLRPGEYERAEAIRADMEALGLKHLRTHFSWADWHTAEGVEWYDWLLPYLSKRVEVLPCFMYTPPSLGIAYKTSSPPREPVAFADFLDQIITRLGRHFEWIELWNEANNLNDWDWHLDPGWEMFSSMIRMAASWAHRRGKRTLLGGMAPLDPNWLDLMCRRGALEHIDAVGVHGFPHTWDFQWSSWAARIASLGSVLDRHRLRPQIWITEAGYSTWRHDEYRQVEAFAALASAPAERAYLYSGYDLHPDLCHQEGFHEDERHYHFGLKTADGRPKLLYRLLAERGVDGAGELTESLRQVAAGLSRSACVRPAQSRPDRVLITGGCGFIGTNLAARLLGQGRRVLLLDNLSRGQVQNNLDWLSSRRGGSLQVEVADIRDPYLMRSAVQQAESVFHLAAQVAVTTSIAHPDEDFSVNARGTLNLLEAIRRAPHRPSLVFTSTNKVYGDLADLSLRRCALRWEPDDPAIRRHGISEDRALDFCSPYGCSKGAADQYLLEYGRSYGLPAVVLRMSCIYGPHQYGTEDQGWLAHFLINALNGRPLTLYGDGAQVRDVLFVDDLVDALLLAEARAADLGPRAFNIGGGPDNVLSLLELLQRMEDAGLAPPRLEHAGWRLADQRYYVSDFRRFAEATGWAPRTGLDAGIDALLDWLVSAGPACSPASARRLETSLAPGSWGIR